MTFTNARNDDPGWVSPLANFLSGFDREERYRLKDKAMLPTACLDELAAFSSDRREWMPGREKEWQSLGRDLQQSFDVMGPHLALEVSRFGKQPLNDVKRLVAQLVKDSGKFRRGSATPTTTLVKLGKLETALRKGLSNQSLLVAALQDVVDAFEDPSTTADECVLRVELLADLLEASKHDRGLLQDLGNILADQSFAIQRIRESLDLQKPSRKLPEQPLAGLSISDRLELCEKVLRQKPQKSDINVWYVIRRARFREGKFFYNLGALTIIDGDWWKSVMGNDLEKLRGPAPGVYNALKKGHESIKTDFDFDRFGDCILMRVDLGKRQMAYAARDAQETIEAAKEYLGSYLIEPNWSLLDGYLLFADGFPSRSRWFTDRREKEDLELKHGMPADLDTDLLDSVEPQLAGKLPIVDSRLHEVMGLMHWLHKSRDAANPEKVLLQVRVIEQVNTWEGGGKWYNFLRNEFAEMWAYRQVVDKVNRAIYQAMFTIPGAKMGASKMERDEFLKVRREMVENEEGRKMTMNNAAMIKRVSWFAKRIDEYSLLGRELKDLESKLATPKDTAKWMDNLVQNFNAQVDRSIRVRNTIAHGGKIAIKTIDYVADFLTSLASAALYTTIEATLLGKRRGYLKRVLADHKKCHRLLRAGKPLIKTLFWKANPKDVT